MLASKSLHSRHYDESIFKQQQQQPAQQLKSIDKDNNLAVNMINNDATDTFARPMHIQRNHANTTDDANDVAIVVCANGSDNIDSCSTFSTIQPVGAYKQSVEIDNSNAMYKDHSNNNNDNNNITNKVELDEKELNTTLLLASHPNSKYEQFIRACMDEVIKSAVFEGTNRSSKVVEWHDPAELKHLYDFTLKMTGESHDKLMSIIRDTIKYSVKTGHPYFINQLYSGLDPYALIGQWLTDALNPSVYTYEVAPIFTLMEEEVLSEMRRIVGFPDNGYGDGIFCPGGSISNGYAISCARYKYAPDTKKNGFWGSQRMIIFTSEDAHYSVEKLAMFMGFGCDNVCKVPTNNVGKMNVNKLDELINKYKSENCRPLMVSATAGTTVLGAFDDLNGIADLCQKYDMWMHVDAAWGGGALVSKKYRHLLNGIERSDSVTWNPHKLLTASQQCSTFLTRHKDVLSQCHSTNATYLFQKDKFYDTSYDTGDKHIQCGRRADVFKFWFMWKAKGTNGLEQHVNQVFKMAEFFTSKLKLRPGFKLVLEQPECTNISFWYVPPSLRHMEHNEEFYAKLHTVAPKVKEGMIKKGSMMITYQPLRKLPNFFRLVLQNSCLNETDMLYFLNEIETLGSKL